MLTALLPDAAFDFRMAFFHPAVRDQLSAEHGLSIVELPDRARWQGYYVDAVWRSVMRCGDGELVELGDGGLTTWTAQLMGNAKERGLVSCISTERLAAVRSGQTGGPGRA